MSYCNNIISALTSLLRLSGRVMAGLVEILKIAKVSGAGSVQKLYQWSNLQLEVKIYAILAQLLSNCSCADVSAKCSFGTTTSFR